MQPEAGFVCDERRRADLGGLVREELGDELGDGDAVVGGRGRDFDLGIELSLHIGASALP